MMIRSPLPLFFLFLVLMALSGIGVTTAQEAAESYSDDDDDDYYHSSDSDDTFASEAPTASPTTPFPTMTTPAPAPPSGPNTFLDMVFKAYSDAKFCLRRTSCNIAYNDRKCCGIDSGDKIIFVTSQEFSADLTGLGYGTGKAGADEICRRSAYDSGLSPNNFSAWFATSDDDSPNFNFTRHRGRYVRPDGQLLFDCYSRLVTSGIKTPQVSLWMDEYSRIVTSTQGAPTNVAGGFYFGSARFAGFDDESGDASYHDDLDFHPSLRGQGGEGMMRDLNDDVGYSSSDDEAPAFGDCNGWTYNLTRGDELDPPLAPVGITESSFGLRPSIYIACNQPIRFICVEQ